MRRVGVRRDADLPSNSVQIEGEKEGSAAKTGRSKSGFTACMTCSYYHNIIILLIIPY